jgi:23S rRNA (adenine1618-N6)-methyltransferase
LIAKSSHLKNIYAALKKAHAREVKTIPMSQGNKSSRIVAWTHLNKAQQKDWTRLRWSRVSGERN